MWEGIKNLIFGCEHDFIILKTYKEVITYSSQTEDLTIKHAIYCPKCDTTEHVVAETYDVDKQIEEMKKQARKEYLESKSAKE